MYPRWIEQLLRDEMADTRVVLLAGPRQAGKTTLAKRRLPHAFSRFAGVICLLMVLGPSMHAGHSPQSPLVREWVDAKPAKTITGRYNNRSAAVSDEQTSHTGLLSIVLDSPSLRDLEIPCEIRQVELLQSEDQLRVTAMGVNGALIATRFLKQGIDYRLQGSELLILENWDGSDEWGTARGVTVNSLVRTQEGHLLVKMTSTVRRRTFLIWSTRESTFYFRFDQSGEPSIPGR